ncbi:proprotein convertase P-domain-containing protein [Vibrio parahaemolyticus]|nr:proprotein convertase P-domain-containing protein [Vibrio parahaemolyticus]
MKLKLLALSLALAGVQVTNAAQWDYPSAAVTVTNQAEALRYLQDNYASAGELKFRYQTRSQLGDHYNFDVWVDGQYQPQRTIVLSTNQDRQIERIFKSLEDTVIRNGEAMPAAELELPVRLEVTEPPALNSGELVTIPVSVFDPDLRTMQQQAAPDSAWNSLEDYPQPLQYVEKQIQVLQSDGKFYLANERVKQVDALALLPTPAVGAEPVRDTSSILPPEGVQSFADVKAMQSAQLGDNAFLQLMAFYHLDNSLQYLSSLSYDLFEEPLRFDGRGLALDNSSYYTGSRALMLGVGGVSPDAADADVILHELGHGIHYQIVPDWAYGHTGAIGEGVGDYWAGSASYRTQYLDAARRGQEFEIDTVFNWDGMFGVRRATRSLWNQRARYFEGAEYRAHESVGGELGDELWSTPLFQALKASVARFGDGSDRVFRDFDSIVLEGMYGVGRGVKMHDLAESTVFAATMLFPEKEYAQILKDSFAQHNLLKVPFNARYQSRYINAGETVELTLSHTGRSASVKGNWSLNNDTSKAVDVQLANTASFSANLPTGLTCGAPFESKVSVDYQFAEGLKAQSWQNVTALVNGIPLLLNKPKTIEDALTDASINSRGQEVQGNKIFVQTLSDKTQKIDDSFAVYLDIEHANLADLHITLTSPQGQSVVLFNHQPSQSGGFTGYFTVQHDPQLQALVGEPSWGTWRLEVSDRVVGNSGALKAWGVSHFNQYQCGADTTSKSNGNGSGGSGSPWALFGLLVLSMLRVVRSRNNDSSKRR